MLMCANWWSNFTILAGLLLGLIGWGYPATVGLHHKRFYREWVGYSLGLMAFAAGLVCLIPHICPPGELFA